MARGRQQPQPLRVAVLGERSRPARHVVSRCGVGVSGGQRTPARVHMQHGRIGPVCLIPEGAILPKASVVQRAEVAVDARPRALAFVCAASKGDGVTEWQKERQSELGAERTIEAGPVEASDHERAQIIVLLPARQVLANLLAPPNLLTLHGAMILVSETASATESSIERLPDRRTRRSQGRCTRHGLRCCWPSPSRSSASSGGLCGSHRRHCTCSVK